MKGKIGICAWYQVVAEKQEAGVASDALAKARPNPPSAGNQHYPSLQVEKGANRERDNHSHLL